VVDVRAAANMFDGFIYLIEWGRTPRAAVRNTLTTERQVYDRCLGVVLNMVDTNRLAPYEGYNSVSYESQRYSSYYQA
jgi:succinoglycan biosynthesis transport protein ExoP